MDDDAVTDPSKLDVRDLRMLARRCDAARVMVLSGRIDPDATATLRQRMIVDASDDGGTDERVVVANLERLTSRLRDELGADY
ncbi:hypothetical protein [Agromyces sp. NPDC058110]|uniref:hypothetical protein n=1 Tax=Agromyces sp. NPDC058110 TaxID=3346345 RepID=UPI0036D7A8E8